MDNPNCNTKRSKGQHLTYEERVEIEIRLKYCWWIYHINKHFGCAYNTIKNEYNHGKILLYNGEIENYNASVGQKKYLENHKDREKTACEKTAWPYNGLRP